MAPITLTPIGRVHSSRTEVKDDFWGQVTSVIELDAAHFTSDSLLGLTDFSHILVVYHLRSIPRQKYRHHRKLPARESGLAARRHFRATEKTQTEQTRCLRL